MQSRIMKRETTIMDIGMGKMNFIQRMDMRVPRANICMDKCDNGIMIKLMAIDENGQMMKNNLSKMLKGGMVSINMMKNGKLMMTCNMDIGMCNYEINEEGINVMWTSDDKRTCNIITECCQSIMNMIRGKYNAMIYINDIPVCCC